MQIKSVHELTNLKGKRAIVTGGAVGIGGGISYRLAEAGAQVLIADINQEHLDQAKETFKDKGWDVAYIRTDISKQEDIAAMCQKAVDEFGGIDILVNNAGIFPNQMVMDMKTEDFERVININLKGVFMAVQHAARQMIEQGNGGSIINITSIDALHPSMAGLAHYDASKHGLWGFTKNVALELAPHKIWVNAVAPGGVSTPGVAALQKAPDPNVDMKAVLEGFLSTIPMHRMGEPDDIAKVVLFLASDMASYMTGSQVVVDGGALLS